MKICSSHFSVNVRQVYLSLLKKETIEAILLHFTFRYLRSLTHSTWPNNSESNHSDSSKACPIKSFSFICVKRNNFPRFFFHRRHLFFQSLWPKKERVVLHGGETIKSWEKSVRLFLSSRYVKIGLPRKRRLYTGLGDKRDGSSSRSSSWENEKFSN